MIRLTIVLCAFLYVAMIVGPEAIAPPSEATPDISTQTNFNPTDTLPASGGGETVLLASTGSVADLVLPAVAQAPTPTDAVPVMTIPGPNGEVIEVTAVIRPNETASETVQLARVEDPAPVATPAPTPEDLVYVTGTRVNMRAGPSTQNPVVLALGFGQEAELIEEIGNGWSHIRDLESGRVGYMAGRFLAPVRP